MEKTERTQAESLQKPDTPPPSKKKKRGDIALTKIQHVRAEMAKIYREARAKKLDVKSLYALTNTLQAIARIIESDDLERRLEELERKLEDGTFK